ncbi:MAG: L-fucose:H+ symporter permease [Lentisphaeraceae bacterium]|nr:L-fucose:H+ symporter permease [Lentisphaeraceae bacterium]
MEYDHTKEVVPKKLMFSFALITLCFALWGAANNMTDLLVTVFRQVKGMSALEASLIQTAFYGAYFCAPIPAALIIKKFGYKQGAVCGLLLYATGAFLCLPASQVDSFSFFLFAFYVFAGGCAIVETSVAPYILSMGPKETATQRINLAQAFNPVGSVSGILLGKFVILANLTPKATFDSLEGAEKIAAQNHDLSFVVQAYMIIGIIGLVVALMILFKKLPNVEHSDDVHHVKVSTSIKRLLANKNYLCSVVAQFCLVGAQIGVWTYVVPYVMDAKVGYDDAASAWWFYFISLCAFLLMRFVCTLLMKFIDPARLLSFFAILAGVFTLGTIYGSGWLGVISVVGISACMSLMFPTIYGLGLTGTGDDKKVGGSGIIMAIVGGAILVPMQGFMNDGQLPQGDFILNVILRNLFSPLKSLLDSLGFHYSVANSYSMPLICFAVIAIYGFIAHKQEEKSGIIHD